MSRKNIAPVVSSSIAPTPNLAENFSLFVASNNAKASIPPSSSVAPSNNNEELLKQILTELKNTRSENAALRTELASTKNDLSSQNRTLQQNAEILKEIPHFRNEFLEIKQGLDKMANLVMRVENQINSRPKSEEINFAPPMSPRYAPSPKRSSQNNEYFDNIITQMHKMAVDAVNQHIDTQNYFKMQVANIVTAKETKNRTMKEIFAEASRFCEDENLPMKFINIHTLMDTGKEVEIPRLVMDLYRAHQGNPSTFVHFVRNKANYMHRASMTVYCYY